MERNHIRIYLNILKKRKQQEWTARNLPRHLGSFCALVQQIVSLVRAGIQLLNKETRQGHIPFPSLFQKLC